jgi:hypothetical protein
LETRDLPSITLAPAIYVPSAAADAPAVADFNRDGVADLAVASLTQNEVNIFLGNGNGTFQPARSFPVGTGAQDVAVGDFNNDGQLDLAVSAYGPLPALGAFSHGTVGILLGNGDGSFQPTRYIDVGDSPRGLAVGDFNGDGKLDFIVANSNDDNVGLLLGNGDGTFRNLGGHDTGSTPTSVAVGDFNCDGKADFAVSNAGSNNVGIFLGRGDGTFQNLGGFGTGVEPSDVIVADFNGDGLPDLATANTRGNSASVLLGNGKGTFQPALILPAPVGPTAVAAGDFNNDGRLDLAVVSGGASQVAVFQGIGSGSFQAPNVFSILQDAAGVAVGDFNHDDALDLVTAHIGPQALAVLLNQAVTTTTLSSSAAPSVTGQLVTYTATVHSTLPGAPIPTGTVSFNVGSSYWMQKSLDSNGQVTVNLAAYAGTVKLTASYLGDGTFLASQGSLSQTTKRASTTVAVTSSANPANAGQLVTLTATVSPVAPGTGWPTGTVTFKDGATILRSGVALQGPGKATLMLVLSPGSHVISAVYGGDSNYLGSVSASLPQQVLRRLDGIVGRSQTDGALWVGLSNGATGFVSKTLSAWPTRDALGNTITFTDVQTGDVNGDGRDDLVGRVTGTGQWWVALANGDGSFTSTVWASWASIGWADARVGDFNGDGRADLAAMAPDGTWWVGLSVGQTFFTTAWTKWNPNSATLTWVDARVGDLNGDGKADLLARNLQTGVWWANLSRGTAFTVSSWAAWNPDAPSLTWVDVQLGDLNADGKADLVGRVKQSGQWWANLSNGASAALATLWATWPPDGPGQTWVDVRLADLNGDGKLDVLGRVKENGQWWAGLSTGSAFSTKLWTTWAADAPGVTWVDVQVGDFNGDGLADITGRTLQNGQWWTSLSGGTTGLGATLWDTWSTAFSWVDVRKGHFVN